MPSLIKRVAVAVRCGAGIQPGPSKWEIAYSFHPTAEQHVGQSSLLSGEYDNSTVHVGTQSLTVGYSFRF